MTGPESEHPVRTLRVDPRDGTLPVGTRAYEMYRLATLAHEAEHARLAELRKLTERVR